MNRIVSAAFVAALGLATAGCNTPQGQNAFGGAVLGGASGALIGSAVTAGSPQGAVVGGLLGATSGAMIGSAITPQPSYGYAPGYAPPPRHRCAQWGYDYYGNAVCQAYY
jgi:hypothetical protein